MLVNQFISHVDTFEQGMNIGGYLPVVSDISSSVRHLFGVAEVVAGIAGVLFGVGLAAQANPSSDAVIRFSASIVGHGFLNIFRASREADWPVGGVLCLAYDAFCLVNLGGRLFTYPVLDI